jgi:hypothetical protein
LGRSTSPVTSSRIVLNGADTTAHLGGRSGQLAHDLGAPRFEAGDHGAVLFEGSGVAVGVLDDDRIDSGLEAMAAGRFSGFQSKLRDRHGLRTVQRKHTMNRSNKADCVPTVWQLVRHDLGDR